MGFHVDMGDVYDMLDALQKSAETQSKQADSAAKAFNNIVNTDAFQGATGEAIKNDAQNVHYAVNLSIKDMAEMLPGELSSDIQDFQSQVKETSKKAIIDQDALQTALNQMSSLQDTYNQMRSETHSIYKSIEDLIDLGNPSSSDFEQQYNDTHDVLQHTIDWVNNFDGAKQDTQTAQLADGALSIIGGANQAGALGFDNPTAQAFYQNNQLYQIATQINTQVEDAKKKQRAEAAKAKKLAEEQQQEWKDNHPIESWLRDTSDAIGNWWGDTVIPWTKGMPTFGIPLLDGFKDVALLAEGAISAAGSLVSGVVISVVQVAELAGELLGWGLNSLMGKTTPDWAMADINGTWNNIKSGAGHVADWAISGMANSPVGQAVQAMLPANSGLHETIANANAVTKADVTGMLNAGKDYLKTLASGDLVAWGGAAFDIGSMFIGVGEANIAAKGAALAGKFAKMAEGAASVTKVGAALAKDALKGMVREAPERMAKFGGDLRTALAHVTGETQAKAMLENMRNVFQRGFGAETDLAFAGGADVLRGTEFAANGAEDVARVARTSFDDALPKGVNREIKPEVSSKNAEKVVQRAEGDQKWWHKFVGDDVEVEHHTPANPGSLRERDADTFSGGVYDEFVLKEDAYVYRAFDGTEERTIGRYFVDEEPSLGLSTQIDSALKPEWGNLPLHSQAVKIPAGTRVYVGNVGKQVLTDGSKAENVIGTLKGGGHQIFVKNVDEVEFGGILR